jgi:hypothetical protein
MAGTKYGTTAEIHLLAVDLTPAIREAIETAAQDCVADIKANAPRDTGTYAEGWTWEWESNKSARVYNGGDNAPLSHLLELGHVVVTTDRGGGKHRLGTTAPKPHIKPAYLRAKPRYEQALDAAKDKIQITYKTTTV